MAPSSWHTRSYYSKRAWVPGSRGKKTKWWAERNDVYGNRGKYVGIVVVLVVTFFFLPSVVIVVVVMTMREYVTQLTTQLANMTTNKTDRNQNSVS